MVEKINTGPKTLGEASKLALAELLLKAAKNPKSEITMDDYNYYIETGKLNFAGGGMASINEMTRPIGMAAGGPFPPEDSVLEKLKKNDPDKELRDKGILPPLQERQGIMAQPAGLMEDTENFMVLGMKLELLRAADSLAEMDRIEKLNPDEIIREFEIFIGEKGS